MPAASQSKRTRSQNLDLIRSVAGLFVVALHFYLHTGYYDQPIGGLWERLRRDRE